MNKTKQKRLEAKGWKFGDADDFLTDTFGPRKKKKVGDADDLLYGATRIKPRNKKMATRFENLPSRGVLNAARVLLIVSMIGLSVYIASCTVLLLASDPEDKEPISCTTDCASKYPDLEYGTDVEGYLDESVN